MAEITQSRVPMSTLLNPDRQAVNSRDDFVDHDHQNLIPALEWSVHCSAAYGQQLWNYVNAMRPCLLHRQPPTHWDPQPIGRPLGDFAGGGRLATPGSGDAVGAADDADGPVGWSVWIAAYAALTSVQAGPHGDSGFGVHEAHRVAGLRLRTP